MATPAPKNEERGLIGSIAWVLIWILVAVVVSIVVEWVVMTKYYPEEGAYHSISLIEDELSYLKSSDLVDTNYGSSLVKNLLDIQQGIFNWLSEGLKLEAAAQGLARSGFAADHFSRFGLLSPTSYALSMLNMINVVTLRIVVIILTLPIFILMLVWGLSIGLTKRSIRKYQVRNESAWLYHKAKKYKTWTIMVPIMVYVAWPESIHPVKIFGPSALAYGASWLVLASKFKRLW
jgi:integrating conjugative element membrane protein (TIGR03747 family)